MMMLNTDGDRKILYCYTSREEFLRSTEYEPSMPGWDEVQHAKPDPASTYRYDPAPWNSRIEWAGEPGDSIPTTIRYCNLPKTLTAEEAIVCLRDHEWPRSVAETQLANLQPGEYTIPDELAAANTRLTRLT